MTIPIRAVPGSLAAPVVTPAVSPARQNARPLPAAVRARMEATFGVDFSTVTVKQDGGLAAAGVAALTRGESITVHPAVADPHTPAGLAVIGHELAHVLQQRAGRVPGTGLTAQPELESEADEAGRRAAGGEQVALQGDGAETEGGAAPASVAQPTLLTGAKRAVRRALGGPARGSGTPGGAPPPTPQPEPAVDPSVRARPEATPELRELEHRGLLLRTQLSQTRGTQARDAVLEEIRQTQLTTYDAEDEWLGRPRGTTRRMEAVREAQGRRLDARIAADRAAHPGQQPGQEGGPADPAYGLAPSSYLHTPADVPDQPAPGEDPAYLQTPAYMQTPAAYLRTPAVGPDVHAPGTDPPYIQTPAPHPYSAAPVLPRRPGQ
jgi:hypothetical protein